MASAHERMSSSGMFPRCLNMSSSTDGIVPSKLVDNAAMVVDNSLDEAPWSTWTTEQLEGYAWQLLWTERRSADGSFFSANSVIDALLTWRVGSVYFWKDANSRVVTMAFREAQVPPNWLNIVSLGVRQFGPKLEHRAHSGFLHEYVGLRDCLGDFVEAFGDALEDSGWLLLMTGWSLGGALATLCAVDSFSHESLRNKPCKRALVSFGAPRTVNRPLAEWLNQQPLVHNIRVQADGDPSNSFPPQAHGAFWHHGRLALLRHENGEWQVAEHDDAPSDEVNALPRLVDRLTTPFQILSIIHPALAAIGSSVVGIVLDLPRVFPYAMVHFTSYQQAYRRPRHTDSHGPQLRTTLRRVQGNASLGWSTCDTASAKTSCDLVGSVTEDVITPPQVLDVAEASWFV